MQLHPTQRTLWQHAIHESNTLAAARRVYEHNGGRWVVRQQGQRLVRLGCSRLDGQPLDLPKPLDES